MSKRITTDEKKMAIIERLVKEGVIDFSEAMVLLEVEVEKEFTKLPFDRPYNLPQPFIQPNPFRYERKVNLLDCPTIVTMSDGYDPSLIAGSIIFCDNGKIQNATEHFVTQTN